VDTGPCQEVALDALERGLRAHGVALADLELVIGTHHHHDHVGLAPTIRRHSGARIAVIEAAADYVERYHDNVAADRRFARELMAAHGVPAPLMDPADALWDYIGATAEAFTPDVRLRDGDTIRAGGRDLRVLARPGHSASDTIFVDGTGRLAFVGDHLLARISPNTEVARAAGAPRSRPRLDYVRSLERTAWLPLDRLFPGHGPLLCSARERVRRELEHQRRRCRRIIGVLEQGPARAFDIARTLWPEAIVREQALLVVWEVLGHLDVMITTSVVHEVQGEDARWCYSLARAGAVHQEEADVALAG
jgi:glyoxylase-like metal-dependent hydrolase (beta-lactamase superfamily II)